MTSSISSLYLHSRLLQRRPNSMLATLPPVSICVCLSLFVCRLNNFCLFVCLFVCVFDFFLFFLGRGGGLCCLSVCVYEVKLVNLCICVLSARTLLRLTGRILRHPPLAILAPNVLLFLLIAATAPVTFDRNTNRKFYTSAVSVDVGFIEKINLTVISTATANNNPGREKFHTQKADKQPKEKEDMILKMDGMHKPRQSISFTDVYSTVLTAVRPRVKPSTQSMEKL